MADDRLAPLQAIDPAVLTQVVRQDQRSDRFEIGDWSVRRLSNQGFANPEGLWVYSGHGRDGQAERPWSVVLKVLKKNDVEVPIDNFFHWQRELFVAQSGLTRRMPGPVQAPRFYSGEEARRLAVDGACPRCSPRPLDPGQLHLCGARAGALEWRLPSGRPNPG